MSQRKAITLIPSKVLFSLIVIAFMAVSLVLPVNRANAAEGLVLSTRFPGISASAGERITFPLEVKNNGNVSQIINLEVTSKPDNWDVSLKGMGRSVQQVFVDGHGNNSLDLIVKIPDEATAGEYPLTVTAISDNGYLQDNLKLLIKITDAKVGNDELTAVYSELKGPSDATFNFKVNLTNNGSSEQVYSLGAQVQEGWQVSFKPSYEDQQVASIGINPGETKSIDVKVNPPVNVEAGDHSILIQAAGPTSKVTEELRVIISGTYNLEFSTPTGVLSTDIVAGRDKKLNLEVKNTGSADLNNIIFSSNKPVDWSVDFEPTNIEILKPGESRQVTAIISADDKAITGDYLVSLDASTQEVKSSADMRVTVKTSTVWGIVGLLIIMAVVFAVYKAFQIYGRR